MLESLNAWLSAVPGGGLMWTVLMFIVVISILVFVHELGHYLAARSMKVRVETFSIGFGKEIWGFNDKSGTRWKVAAIPLGGFVKMVGDDRTDQAAQQPGAFFSKSVWARMWIVVAGPLANFLFAVVVLTGLMMVGEQKLAATLGDVQPESAAEAAGLKTGDTVLTVDGTPVDDWTAMSTLIGQRGGVPTTLTVKRSDETLTVAITPKLIETKDIFGDVQRIGLIGVRSGNHYFLVQHPANSALVLGVQRTWEITTMTLKAIWRMITGAMPADIGGPLTIADMAGKSAENGGYALLMFMVIISINLGLLNLFPIPILDGGHLVYFAVEAVKGSPVGERAQDVGYRVGLSILVLLMSFAFYKDIMRIIMPMLAD